MGATCLIPSIDEIVYINCRMIEAFGGLFLDDPNFKNRDSLEHVLWQTQNLLFGEDRYPTVIDKAAAIGWRIITSHVFHDGNKRTGIETCRLMLALNGYKMIIDQNTVEVTLKTAAGEVTLEEFTQWVASKTQEV